MVDSKENYKFHLRVKGLTTTKAAMFNKSCFILPCTNNVLKIMLYCPVILIDVFLIIAELAKHSPIIIQNSSNPSS